jgi:hypothetical protein
MVIDKTGQICYDSRVKINNYVIFRRKYEIKI